jgi:hypothetical protein
LSTFLQSTFPTFPIYLKEGIPMSLNRVLKVATNKVYSGWDFNGDGMFDHDRVKGRDKRNRARYQRTLQKRFTQREIRTYEYVD